MDVDGAPSLGHGSEFRVWGLGFGCFGFRGLGFREQQRKGTFISGKHMEAASVADPVNYFYSRHWHRRRCFWVADLSISFDVIAISTWRFMGSYK